MRKITIKDIEEAIKLLQTTEVKNDSDNGVWAENINNKLDLEIAIRKLPTGDQEIIQMYLGGFSFKEIETELKIENLTTAKIYRLIRGIINK